MQDTVVSGSAPDARTAMPFLWAKCRTGLARQVANYIRCGCTVPETLVTGILFSTADAEQELQHEMSREEGGLALELSTRQIVQVVIEGMLRQRVQAEGIAPQWEWTTCIDLKHLISCGIWMKTEWAWQSVGAAPSDSASFCRCRERSRSRK